MQYNALLVGEDFYDAKAGVTGANIETPGTVAL
jgi:hypothetical protein